MPKALLPKAKRSWLRPLLPAAMAAMTTIVVTVETAVAHRLKSPEVTMQVLAATAASRLQNPEVAAAAPALPAMAASRLQNLEVAMQVLAATAVSRLQSPASD